MVIITAAAIDSVYYYIFFLEIKIIFSNHFKNANSHCYYDN